jgi:hypothetical protein
LLIFKAVAYPANGTDERLVPKFPAHVPQVNIHHAHLTEIFGTPDSLEELFT